MLCHRWSNCSNFKWLLQPVHQQHLDATCYQHTPYNVEHFLTSVCVCISLFPMQSTFSATQSHCWTPERSLANFPGPHSTSCCNVAGEKYTFTIKEGADGRNGRISVNYDGFIDDVGVGDMLLVDGGLLSLKITKKEQKDVICEVVDGGMMGSRSLFASITEVSFEWSCNGSDRQTH